MKGRVDAFDIRRAEGSDVDDIADAHRDSILSVGSPYYPPDVVVAWQEDIAGQLYLQAMDHGEVFFIATGCVDGKALVLGFSSDYSIEGATHGTSVYVRGVVARQGVGTALLRAAESHAIANGAAMIRIEASLAGVPFYEVNGYVEVGRGEVQLRSGYPIQCVFMQKSLAAAGC
jgi:GNAT superfamily N-acetyltransferase